jgi:hypothetical protein
MSTAENCKLILTKSGLLRKLFELGAWYRACAMKDVDFQGLVITVTKALRAPSEVHCPRLRSGWSGGP